MRFLRYAWCLAAMLPALVCAHTLKLDPASLSVSGNSNFTLDLIATDLDASGAGSIVSAFSVGIGFDPARIAYVGTVFSDALGDEFLGESIHSDVSGAGTVDLLGASNLDDAALDALQGPAVTLARLTFRALPLNAGETEISTDILIPTLTELIGGCLVPDPNGGCLAVQVDDQNSTTLTGSTVRVVATAPEPHGLALLGMVLCALGALRRRRAT